MELALTGFVASLASLCVEKLAVVRGFVGWRDLQKVPPMVCWWVEVSGVHL